MLGIIYHQIPSEPYGLMHWCHFRQLSVLFNFQLLLHILVRAVSMPKMCLNQAICIVIGIFFSPILIWASTPKFEYWSSCLLSHKMEGKHTECLTFFSLKTLINCVILDPQDYCSTVKYPTSLRLSVTSAWYLKLRDHYFSRQYQPQPQN